MNPVKQLSIITPAWNSAGTLQATLASIRPLIEAGAEHIVVDSGSEDGTQALSEAAGAQVLYCPPGNMYAAINDGLKAAKGKWLTYINSDDLLYADVFADICASEANQGDIVYGNLDYIDENGRYLFSWRTASEKYVRKTMLSYSSMLQPGTYFKRSVFETLNGFDTKYKYSADVDFFLRAISAGFDFKKFKPRTVAAFRLMQSQLSHENKADMQKEYENIRRLVWASETSISRKLNDAFSSLYRNSMNLDSRLMRLTRANKKDQR